MFPGANIFPLDSVLGGVELLVDSPLIVGCYSISFPNSNTPVSLYMSSLSASIPDCLIQCGVGQFAAITNGVNCVCFPAFPHDLLIPSKDCTTGCPGNSSMFCGGPTAYTIAVACKENFF